MTNSKATILVLGASGMLGSAIFASFVADQNFRAVGTLRWQNAGGLFTKYQRRSLIFDLDINDEKALKGLFEEVQPQIVVNCIGIVKQLPAASDPSVTLPVNSLLPHKLADLCKTIGARLIHFSTDCVFSGRKGMYTEKDETDAFDLYGISKKLGELDYSNTLTLRTSIIGHEMQGERSLVDWFLSQQGSVQGFSRAIFSGLPTVVIADLIRDYILPNPKLSGLYHLSAEPISKYELLCKIKNVYGKDITINKDATVKIDRSLDSSKFAAATGFRAPTWDGLIHAMHSAKLSS